MRRSILSFGLLLSSLLIFGSVNAQEGEEVTEKGAKVSFDKDVHDYGTIEQGGDGTCEFTFTNNGSKPLIISRAKGSCGCTVPSWPKEPIAPGDSDVIQVKYDTKRVGPINKSVTITSNAKNSPTKVIRIKGKVKAKPKGSAPTNGSGAPAN